jgi:transposase
MHMLARHAISDADWARIEPFLPKYGPAKTKRQFVDAILFVGKTAIPWRDLPERFGDWNAVWKRFDRWSQAGRWQQLFDALQDPDLEWLILDSTVIRAHPCAAGAKKKRTGPGDRKSKPWAAAEAGLGPRFTSA